MRSTGSALWADRSFLDSPEGGDHTFSKYYGYAFIIHQSMELTGHDKSFLLTDWVPPNDEE